MDQWGLYQNALTEQRFQLTLNEARANRFTGFTALLLAAAIASDSSVIALLASAVALTSMSAIHTGHLYYRSIRDTTRRLADQVDASAGKNVTPRATDGQGSSVRGLRYYSAQQFFFVAMAMTGIFEAVRMC
jgi:hypothetical protein